MKIVQLTAENIKKLRVVDITPSKDFIQITGANGSGKTSVLDSIWWALAGSDAIQGQPIRKGEQKAMIRLDLGECVVTRKFTEKGTTLTVENAEGFRAPSPQAILDGIIGHLAFDPLEFSRMNAKSQFDALKVIAKVGVDLESLAAMDTADKDKRRDAKRDMKTLEGQLAGIVIAEDAPDEAVIMSDLLKELQDIEDANSVIIEDNNRVEKFMAESNKAENLIQLKETQISGLKAEIKSLNDLILLNQTSCDAIRAGTGEIESTDAVKAKIAGAQEINNAVADKKRKAHLENQIREMQAQIDGFDNRLTEREFERSKALSASTMPIDGLTLGDKQVIFNDIPFDQLSAAEQLRVSVAIAMAANPKLKVIRIKDGSLLDDSSLKIIQEMAKDKEYQVWCETVNTSGKVGIVMEDGEVSAINEGE